MEQQIALTPEGLDEAEAVARIGDLIRSDLAA
jgi:phosphotransferase system HPr-like phosphotransfer protein